jgi:predicted DNA-binding protein
MSDQMLIRIDETIKERFQRIARNEGKSMTQKARELIETYVEDHDISSYIDTLWDRIGTDLKKKKTGPGKIERAIRDVRSSG